MAKYDAAGNHLWSRRFGNIGLNWSFDVAVDQVGNAVVTGMFGGTMDFGGGPLTGVLSETFVAKYDTAGNHMWSRHFDSNNDDRGQSVAVDKAGNVIVTGMFKGTVNFGGGPITSVGTWDTYVAKLNSMGVHIWSHGFGGNSVDEGNGVAVDRTGNLLVTGSFSGTMDPGGGPLVSAGGRDIYLAKFGRDIILAHLDIKPGSCPNPFNMNIIRKPPKNEKSKKGGVLPVAILGTVDFDVTDIDITTVRLEGVAPLRHSYEDVAAPVVDGQECECTTAGPDNHLDLVLKFRKFEIAAVLGEALPHAVTIPLTLTGQLIDGTPFAGSDCIKIVGKKDDPSPKPYGNVIVLNDASPNPFNPITRIRYYLPKEEYVELSVYDVRGKLVDRLVTSTQQEGEHVAEWDASDMTSGIYFYRLEVGEFTQTKKLILLK